jgi:hypothetical protein
MKILTRQQIGSADWNAFCDLHPGAWWWWRGEWLDYQVARGTRDLSFGVLDGDRLLAICPLLLEERGASIADEHMASARDTIRSFTIEGHPGPIPPLFLNRSTISEAAIMVQMEIERLAYNHEIHRIAFRGSPLVSQTNIAPQSFHPCGWHTQLLDLTQSEAALHAGIRKSYTALINKAEREYEIVVDAGGKLLPAFREIHREKSGRETRPAETWDMMRSWCETDNGLHVCALHQGRVVACAYFEVYKRAAYYGHASSLVPNVQHALIWRAIRELKARGVEQLEMGWIDYPPEDIGTRGKFKAGFGGRSVPVIAVERRW